MFPWLVVAVVVDGVVETVEMRHSRRRRHFPGLFRGWCPWGNRTLLGGGAWCSDGHGVGAPHEHDHHDCEKRVVHVMRVVHAPPVPSVKLTKNETSVKTGPCPMPTLLKKLDKEV